MLRIFLPLLAVLAAGAGTAWAHIGANFQSLNTLLARADLVVVARVVNPDAIYRRPDLAFQQPYVEIEVVEDLKGTSPYRRLDFFGHGHGIARYHRGDEAIFFFTEIGKDPTWWDSPLAERFAWYSDQEVQHKFPLTAEGREEWIRAARRYLKAQGLSAGPERAAMLLAITIDLIGSGQERLAMLAMQDFILVPNIRGTLSREQMDRLIRLSESPAVNLAIRVVLLQKLAADPGFPLYDRLLAAYRQADQAVDKVAVIHALSRCRDGRLVGFLKPLLGDEDPRIRRAAIDGLSQPGLDQAVPLLTQSLNDPAPFLHAAMIRALGRIGTPMASGELARLSEEHPNEVVRRYAAAELRRRDRPVQTSPDSQPSTIPAEWPWPAFSNSVGTRPAAEARE